MISPRLPVESPIVSLPSLGPIKCVLNLLILYYAVLIFFSYFPPLYCCSCILDAFLKSIIQFICSLFR